MKEVLFYFFIFFNTVSYSQINLNSDNHIIPSAISSRSPSVLQYTQSLKYCANLVEAGFSDWRLPKLQELEKYIFSGGIIPSEGITTYIRGGFTTGDTISGIVNGYIFTCDSNGSGQIYSVIVSQNSTGFSPSPIGTNFCHCVR